MGNGDIVDDGRRYIPWTKREIITEEIRRLRSSDPDNNDSLLKLQRRLKKITKLTKRLSHLRASD